MGRRECEQRFVPPQEQHVHRQDSRGANRQRQPQIGRRRLCLLRVPGAAGPGHNAGKHRLWQVRWCQVRSSRVASSRVASGCTALHPDEDGHEDSRFRSVQHPESFVGGSKYPSPYISPTFYAVHEARKIAKSAQEGGNSRHRSRNVRATPIFSLTSR